MAFSWREKFSIKNTLHRCSRTKGTFNSNFIQIQMLNLIINANSRIKNVNQFNHELKNKITVLTPQRRLRTFNRINHPL